MTPTATHANPEVDPRQWRADMHTTPQTALRELDHRTSDGIDVRLLWNPDTNRVSIAVTDECSAESFEFAVNKGDALDAFRHPYAYAAPLISTACSQHERQGG
jgi:hypothetical protein